MEDYKNASNEYRRFIVRFSQSKNYDKAIFYLAYSTENLPINPDFEEALNEIILLESSLEEGEEETSSSKDEITENKENKKK